MVRVNSNPFLIHLNPCTVSYRLSPAEATLEGAGALDSQVSAGSVTTAAVVGAPLTDLTISTEAMSVVSVTSQCSYSSTIVHVPQPESGEFTLTPHSMTQKVLHL